jgi:phenylalanyl-tRNA synthetase beta chain
MRISLNWVRRIIGADRLPLATADLKQRLTLRTAEVEHDHLTIGPNLTGVVVGKVLECRQHPNADRLRCTVVDIGAGAPVPVVCGAPNVAVGQTVAVATVGTTLTLPDKEGKPTPVTIKAAKLRGEPSQGMICAEDEIGLGTSHDGIMVLPDHLAAGTPLAEALGIGDTVLQVENIAVTHRPDLWGHWGWAREIAALCGLPAPAEPDHAWIEAAGAWRVDLRDAGCPAYAGAVVEGVHNGESPRWMRELLESAGVRPLGLLVDITNYVMLDLGEPMHAFDRREIVGTTVVVRAANPGEVLKTLDGREQKLEASDIVIADEQSALALAGIMGGERSGVRADTTSVVLEAAVFTPERIRRTRKRLGIATDSAARFEKGPQRELLPAAINRAVALLAELCPGSRVVHRFHAGDLAGAARSIPFDAAEPGRITGLPIAPEAAWTHLAALGFQRTGEAVAVPWWRRKDVQRSCDLIEEVARCHGYEHIQGAAPRLPAETPAIDPLRAAEHRARRALSAAGWDEVTTYAFTSQAWATALGWDRAIVLSHPMSSEQTVMRADLLPTLLEACANNRKHLGSVAIYEVGKVYAAGAGAGTGITPDERLVVAGCVAAAGDEAPFYAARDAALAVLAALGHAGSTKPMEAVPAGLAAERTVEVAIGGKVVGLAGEVARDHRQRAGCPERVGFFVIELERLIAAVGPARPVIHRAPSRFPAVDRDYTWECPEPLPFGDLDRWTRKAAGELCTGVALVGIYRGAPYPADRKAVSLRLTLQAADRTLQDAEVAKLHDRLVTLVGERTGAVLRG